MTNITTIALSAVTIALLSGCGDTTVNQTPSNVNIITDSYNGNATPTEPTEPTNPGTPPEVEECVDPTKQETLSGDLTNDRTLTADTLWILDGLVAVKNGATLTIEPCTTVAGLAGTGDSTSYMIIDKGSKIMAEGESARPITFTSAKVAVDGGTADVGQWGGLTLIGHAGNDQVNPYEVNTAFFADATNMADSSGILKHVKILNSGITMAEDKEINGLSLVGVGSGTTIEDLTVDYSDDDCVEAWGGTVNFTNVSISHCTDDHFDIDDGYSGTVKNLVINQTGGNAGIEMSGHTVATFDGFTITQNVSNKEGGIYFKKDGIGGHFLNGTVIDNSVEGAGTIHSRGDADLANISFTNVTLEGTSSDERFTNDIKDDGAINGSAADIEELFDNGTGNTVN